MALSLRHSRLLRSFLNVLLVFLVFLPWIAIHAGVKPFRRGFFCGDQSLMHPFKESTVPGVVVFVIGISLNALVIAIFETISLHEDKVKMSQARRCRIIRCNVHQEIVNFFDVFAVFLFGAATQQTAVNIGKFSIGRLRPHFFAACHLNYTTLSCVDTVDLPRYVTEYVCTATEEYKTLDMRLSFPSGHASMSAYSMVFIVMYLEARMTWQRLHLIRVSLQAMALWLALGVCLSRISDYKHHWSDVLAGALLGGFVAVAMIRYALRLRRPWTLDCLDLPALSTLVTRFQNAALKPDDMDDIRSVSQPVVDIL